jgi:hypothetical protein
MGQDNLYYKSYEELKKNMILQKNSLLNMILFGVAYINHQQKHTQMNMGMNMNDTYNN